MNLKSVARVGVTLDVEYGDYKTNTKLQEFVGEDSFVVFQPTHDGVPIITRAEELLEFAFTRDSGVFLFDAKLEKTYIKDNLVLAQYKVEGKLRKIQRRQSYRLDIRLGAIVKLISADDVETVRTVDICEGGMKFEGLKNYFAEQMLRCEIFLQENEIIEVAAQVKRTVKSKDDDHLKDVSVSFFNVSKQQQAQIRKFVMKQQLALRQRLR